MRRTFLGVVAVFVSVGGLRADDRPLPKGYPPTTARASLDGGTVTVRIPVIGYEVKKAEGGGGTLVPVAKENVVRLDLKEIEAFDTRGRKVDAEALRDRLKAEEPVLVSHEGAADPYYLGVVKEGTLVLVVPVEKLRPGIPEAIPAAGIPEAGANPDQGYDFGDKVVYLVTKPKDAKSDSGYGVYEKVKVVRLADRAFLVGRVAEYGDGPAYKAAAGKTIWTPVSDIVQLTEFATLEEAKRYFSEARKDD